MGSKFLNLDIDTTLGGDNSSDIKVASQKAVKAYVDSQTGTAPSFSNLTGDPYDNTNLATALNAKVSDVTVNSASVVNNGTAVIPIAQASGGYGLVKLSDSTSGLQISNNGNLIISYASTINIDAKTNNYKPIVPSNLDYAVKVGVTTNTNALTDSEQNSANKWLGSQKKLVAKDGGGAVDIVEVFDLPLGYTQLDYIYNTASTTKLDLGIKPQDGDIIETVFIIKKTGISNYYIQARETSSSYIYGIGGGSANTLLTSSVNNYSAVSSSVQREVDHKYYIKTSYINGTITLNVKDLTTDVEETTTTTYTYASVNSNYYLWGNGVQTLSGVQPCQLVRITNGATVRACIVPATDGTDVGFYDVVNNTFITTMTAGTITGGNPILGAISVPPATVGGDYGAVKIDSADYGIGIHTNGFLMTSYATTSNITNKNATYKPITPINLDLAVKTGVTTNTITLTDAEKTAALSWLGAQESGSYVNDVTIDGTSIVSSGTAQIPNASGSVTGVVKLSANLTSISNTIAATASMGNNLAKNIITGVNTYSSSSTYSVGDKVRYDQYYYECNTAITSGHAWNANEWTQITIQGQIDEKLDDVTINGTSIVSNNVAAIPIAAQSGDYGLVKLSSDSAGINLSSSGSLQLRRATDADIAAKTQLYRPIVPGNLDLAVKTGVTTNTITLTDAEKTAACTWIGASQGAVKRVWYEA